MRTLSALLIAGMLAGIAPANAAYVCRGPWHCAWWVRGPHQHWRWHGPWHRGGRWVRIGPRWVYRWR